jgi:Na+-driven multidrug efflux pump
MLTLPVVGFQIASSGYFQAVGKPRQAMVLMLSRQVLILIPAILILPRFFGLRGIYYAGPVSDLASALLTAVWLTLELRHLSAAGLPASAGNLPAQAGAGPAGQEAPEAAGSLPREQFAE